MGRNRHRIAMGAGLLVLVVCSGLLAYALPRTAAQPNATTPSATGVHSWWAMTPKEAARYMDEGRTWARQGKPATDLHFGLEPGKGKMVTKFDRPDTFVAVALLVPACVLRRAGYKAEQEAATAKERQELLQRELKGQQTLDFVGLIGPASEATAKAGVKLQPYVDVETSTGKKLRLDKPTSPQELADQAEQGQPGVAIGRSQGVSIVIVKIPVKNKAGEPWLTAGTKWVKLSLYGEQKTLPITFNVTGPVPGLAEEVASRCQLGPVA